MCIRLANEHLWIFRKSLIPSRATDKHLSSSQQTYTHVHFRFPIGVFVCLLVCVLLSFNFDVLCLCVVYGHRPYQHCNVYGFVLRSTEYSNDSSALNFPFLSMRCDEYIHSTTVMTTIYSIDIKKRAATARIIPIKTAPCIVRCCFRIGQCQHICNMIAIKIVLMFSFN